MNHFLLAAIALWAFGASAQTPPRGLCAATEEAVFSCTLKGSQKTVSLCASREVGTENRQFRYLFGRPSKIELQFPTKTAEPGSFSRTHLTFASDTGGYAYSFTNGHYKYILYSISGARGLERQGLAVQRIGSMPAASDRSCRPSTLIQTDNDIFRRATRTWKADPDIEKHGVPSTANAN